MAYPYVYNINYYTGDTYQFVLYPKNEDGTTLNLSGFTATFTIAPQRGAASSTIVLTPQINLNPTMTQLQLLSFSPVGGKKPRSVVNKFAKTNFLQERQQF